MPPGFVITTEVFRGYEGVMGYKYIYEDLKRRIYKEIKELERITGKTFGNPDEPPAAFREKRRNDFTSRDDVLLSQCGDQ